MEIQIFLSHSLRFFSTSFRASKNNARLDFLSVKGLAITFVSEESDAKILNEVQERFEVDITELPDEIDLSTYIEGRWDQPGLCRVCSLVMLSRDPTFQFEMDPDHTVQSFRYSIFFNQYLNGVGAGIIFRTAWGRLQEFDN